MGQGSVKPHLLRLKLLGRAVLQTCCTSKERNASEIHDSGKLDLCSTVSRTNHIFIQSTGGDTTPQTTQAYAQLSWHPVFAGHFVTYLCDFPFQAQCSRFVSFRCDTQMIWAHARAECIFGWSASPSLSWLHPWTLLLLISTSQQNQDAVRVACSVERMRRP